jgi:transposase-like protein
MKRTQAWPKGAPVPKAGTHKLGLLPKEKRDEIVRDVVLGRKSMFQVSREMMVSDTSVSRFMRTVLEEERLAILAQAAHDAKIAEANRNAILVNELGEDTEKDLKWVLHELKTLLSAARGDDEKLVQLGTLKEVRQALMSLAELQGKLNRKVEISLNLNESPQFQQLRSIILSVLDRHPEAKADFLQEMRVLQVIDAKAVPA